MADFKDNTDNNGLRIKSPVNCPVSNMAYNNASKKAYIIYGLGNCGKTNTVCFIADALRTYYGKRQVTAVLNEALKKEILHVTMVDGDVNKCMGFSSRGDERETVMNNTLSLCLSYSKLIVIAVRDAKTGAKVGLVTDVETICQSFGYSVQKYQLTKAKPAPINGVNQVVANQIINDIKQVIP